jgi:hypothetical protein
MSEYDCCDRHLYLYAKEWYKKSDDILQDLKIIVGERSGLYPEHITENDILIVLSELVWKHLKNYTWSAFYQFLFDCRDRGFIPAFLTVLDLTKKSKIGFDLGEPDYNILPKPDKG